MERRLIELGAQEEALDADARARDAGGTSYVKHARFIADALRDLASYRAALNESEG